MPVYEAVVAVIFNELSTSSSSVTLILRKWNSMATVLVIGTDRRTPIKVQTVTVRAG
jgi:hypothetical protein